MLQNKLLILGIDSSKRKTGVSLITYTRVDDKDVFELVDRVLITTKAFKGEPLFKSELDSYNMLKLFLTPYMENIDYGVLEGFAFGGQGLTTLAATAAVYQLLLAQNGKQIVHIAPSRVKKIIAGDGHADKTLVRDKLKDWLINFDSIVWPSLDVSDSAAIAIASAIVNIYPERFATVKKVRVTKKGPVNESK